jgi:hypothetical protein
VVLLVQKAVENKEMRAVLSHVSQTYNDPRGNNYEGIKGLLFFYVFKHPKESIFIPDMAITVKGKRAEAKFQAVLAGRGRTTLKALPEAMGVYNFDVSFLKENGDWKIISATWERFRDGPGGDSIQTTPQ